MHFHVHKFQKDFLSQYCPGYDLHTHLRKYFLPLLHLSQQRNSLLLEEIQQAMFDKAKKFRDEHITEANDWNDFEKLLDEKGGFISAHWDGSAETEDAIKEKTKATVRCIPLNNPKVDGKCILTGKPSSQRVLFARAY